MEADFALHEQKEIGRQPDVSWLLDVLGNEGIQRCLPDLPTGTLAKMAQWALDSRNYAILQALQEMRQVAAVLDGKGKGHIDWAVRHYYGLETVRMLVQLAYTGFVHDVYMALHEAAETEQLDIIRFLMQLPNIDKKQATKAATTSLTVDVLKFVFAMSDNWGEVNPFVFERAINAHAWETVRYLIGVPGVDPSEAGNYALCVALVYDNMETVEVLLNHPLVDITKNDYILIHFAKCITGDGIDGDRIMFILDRGYRNKLEYALHILRHFANEKTYDAICQRVEAVFGSNKSDIDI